jgi:hypothetical protein
LFSVCSEDTVLDDNRAVIPYKLQKLAEKPDLKMAYQCFSFSRLFNNKNINTS